MSSLSILTFDLLSTRLPLTRRTGLDLARRQAQAVSNEFGHSLCEEVADLGVTVASNVTWEDLPSPDPEGC